MSRRHFPPGTFCRRHPNYTGTRPPQVKDGCSVCELLWTMFGRKSKADTEKK